MLYQTIRANNWNDLVKEKEKLQQTGDDWIFRGQNNSSWLFESSLERAMRRFNSAWEDATRIEGGLLRRFQRQAQQYISALPDASNYIEWLALMQHYGAPTRLLDWTHSFYVAMFFALDGADPGTDTAVWSLNWTEVWEKLLPAIMALSNADRNLQKPKSFEQVLFGKDKFVIKIAPFRFNDRLILQQGTFLAPSNVHFPFWKYLEESLKAAKSGTLKKFEISHKAQGTMLEELFDMNLTRATLFPGLEGFSR